MGKIHHKVTKIPMTQEIPFCNIHKKLLIIAM